MKEKSLASIELYEMMLEKGYDEQLSDLITKNLNTDYTASRMIGYLSHYQMLPVGEVVDEMLAILDDRNRLVEHHRTIDANKKWNEYLNRK